MSETIPTPPSTGHRVRRALRTTELTALGEAIDTATNLASLLAAVVGVFQALLADLGETLTERTDRIDPRQYAIPQQQWQGIADAVTNRAHAFGGVAAMALDLINVMPATYDDPAVPVPDLIVRDHRPDRYHLELSLQATEEIRACEVHLRDLAAYFGPDSDIYRQALSSWHAQLVGLFSTGLGDHRTVHRDGELSLVVTTSGGFVYGIVFHGQRRTCTTAGCGAVAVERTDNHPPQWQPVNVAAGTEHVHTPSYPFYAPQPGTWTSHS